MFLTLLVGASCGPDQELTALTPTLELCSSELDFDEQVIGNFYDLTCAVQNTGGGTLVVESVAFTSSSSERFTLPEGFVDEIGPNSEAELVLRYTPDEVRLDTAELEIVSNDPDVPTLRVPVAATGVDPEIDIDPSTLWFDEVAPGGSKTLTLDINARGSGRLNLQSLDLSDGADAVFQYRLPDGVELPYKMDPGSGIEVLVDFIPDDDEGWDSQLLVTSSDPDDTTVAVRLLANTDYEGEQPPEVEITTPDWGNYLVYGEDVDLEATAVDDATSPTQLTVSWLANGVPISGGGTAGDASGRHSITTDELPEGEVTIVAYVTDTTNWESGNDSVDVTVWAEDQPILYTITGGLTVFDYWNVDDDVTIYVDDEVIFQDTNHTSGSHAPVEFEAEKGSLIRIVANDVNECDQFLDELYLHFGTSEYQKLNDQQCRSSCASHDCYDSSFNGPWPNVFYDEEIAITIPSGG